MDGKTVLYILIGIAVMGGMAYFSYLKAKKRREAFAAFARSQGWTYLAADHSLAGQWQGEPFGNGDNRRAINAVAGPFQGREIIAFDYSYQTHSTDSKGRRTTQTHRYGIAVMRMPGALPHLQVEREGIFGGAFANALGFRDLQFESEDFNRSFRVKAADDRFGHGVVHPRMMELLLAEGGYSWRFEGNTLVCWSSGQQEPNLILAKLDHLRKVLELVPPYIWKDYAGIEARGTGAG
jgi:hypothetical protein